MGVLRGDTDDPQHAPGPRASCESVDYVLKLSANYLAGWSRATGHGLCYSLWMWPNVYRCGRLMFLLFLLEGPLTLWGCSGDKPAHQGATSFADLDAYFASSEWAAADRDRVIFIGIDGASWQFIDPLVERGDLPNFARLKKDGAWATLRSLPCHFSPPAWTTLMSGYLPEKSGVHTFGKWHPDTREFVNVNAEDIAVPSLWDVASYGGKRSAVINVPMTYPVHPVNGIAISGLMTPIATGEIGDLHNSIRQNLKAVPVDDGIRSYSRIALNAADDALNSFRWSLYDTVDDGQSNYHKVLLSVAQTHTGSRPAASPPEIYSLTVGEYSPWLRVRARNDEKPEQGWCKVRVAESNGRYQIVASPVFFPIAAPYCYPDSFEAQLLEKFRFYLPTKFVPGDFVPERTVESVRYAKYFLELEAWEFYAYVFTQSDNIHHTRGFGPIAADVYKIIDRFIGELMDRLDDDTTLIIASDHGFGRFTYGVDLNQCLESAGLLSRKPGGAIDYDRTLVFHNLWHLYFNHSLLTKESLEARGIAVPPGDDPVAALQRYLQRLGRSLKSPDGETVAFEFVALPPGAGPDMRVDGVNGDYVVEFWNLRKPHPTLFFELEGGDRFQHRRDGIFAAWGNGVAKGTHAGAADIEDVAPTILYILDLPIASDMDGGIIDAAFSPRYRSRKGARFVPDYAAIQTAKLHTVEHESLEKKLRSLGYIR